MLMARMVSMTLGKDTIYLVLYRLVAAHGRQILTHCRGRVRSLEISR